MYIIHEYITKNDELFNSNEGKDKDIAKFVILIKTLFFIYSIISISLFLSGLFCDLKSNLLVNSIIEIFFIYLAKVPGIDLILFPTHAKYFTIENDNPSKPLDSNLNNNIKTYNTEKIVPLIFFIDNGASSSKVAISSAPIEGS